MLLLPCGATALVMIFGERIYLIAIAIVFVTALIITIEHSWPRLRRRRLILFTDKDVRIFGRRNAVVLQYSHIKSVGRYDLVPSLHKSDGGRIFLMGYFDGHAEWMACADIIEAYRGSAAERIDGILLARFGRHDPAMPVKSRSPRHPFQVFGVMLFALSMVFMVILMNMSPLPPRSTVLLPFLGYFGGTALALIGTWKSDKTK